MTAFLARSSYGKSRVRLVKVSRHADRHDVTDLTVAVQLEGDFEACHVAGDNSAVLPTDTMKNTVYALAARHAPHQVERFALALVRHFLDGDPRLTGARVDIAKHDWSRIEGPTGPHADAFVRASAERRVASVHGREGRLDVEGGLEELVVLKTARSGFAGYIRDRYTTLAETDDRLMATAVSARWRYGDAELDFDACWTRARTALLQRFAEHDSRSVQHTLYAMAEAVLEVCPEIQEVRMSLPNRHHLLVDLSPFGVANRNEIFVPTDEPHGLIEAVVTRDKTS